MLSLATAPGLGVLLAALHPVERSAAEWDGWRGSLRSGWVGLFPTECWLILPSECGSSGCHEFGARVYGMQTWGTFSHLSPA